jgi:hypothetical protein
VTEPTPAPTTPAPAPQVTLTPTTPAPGTPTPTPAPAPSGDPAPGAPTDPAEDEFTSDRQKRRFAELTGRVGVRERERDEARARVEQLLTREAERVAAGSLAVPADVWFEGARVAELLTEDGSDVDADKVKAIVDQLLAKRPGMAKPAPTQPLPGGHALPPAGKPATFAEVMQDLTKGRI